MGPPKTDGSWWRVLTKHDPLGEGIANRFSVLALRTPRSEERRVGSTKMDESVVESSNKTWSTGEGNGKPLQYFCLENPINSMKRQKDRTLER